MAFDYMTVQYRSLQDRSVVITGGASGIGEEIVRAFAVGCAIPGGTIRSALTSGNRKGRLCMLPSNGRKRHN